MTKENPSRNGGTRHGAAAEARPAGTSAGCPSRRAHAARATAQRAAEHSCDSGRGQEQARGPAGPTAQGTWRNKPAPVLACREELPQAEHRQGLV